MMQPSQNIFIYSSSIRSGKTTKLLPWANAQESIGGILTPDVAHRRYVYDIAHKDYTLLQLCTEEEGIRIGRFVMDKNAMAKARTILLESFHSGKEWTVVDEIGRLEIDRQEGLEPAVGELIALFEKVNNRQKLLLVVRDYLLDRVIEHYQIATAKMVHPSFFHSPTQLLQPLYGLVLCGGESTRMGTPKALIAYHQKPQYQRVQDLLHPFCDKVIVSCKQGLGISESAQIVYDAAAYQNQGPMSGVQSVRAQYPNAAFFVVGCDYPYLQRRDLLALYNERCKDYEAVCYMHPSTHIAEPLITIYEASAWYGLSDFFAQGNRSLRFYLKEIRTKYLVAQHPLITKSVDDEEDRNQFQQLYATRSE